MNNYDEEFLEIIGLYIGDGSIYKTSNHLVFELQGNLNEKQFDDSYILNLFNKYIEKVTIGFRSGGKNGCYGIRTCNKEFILRILDTGFKPGKKLINSNYLKFVNGAIKRKEKTHYTRTFCIRWNSLSC